MSLRDDTIVRNERGQIVKGSAGLHRKSEQPDAEPDLDATFDSDLIAVANTYGKPRSKVGRRAWCENFRDTKPEAYATQLRISLARQAEAAQVAASGVTVIQIGMIPNDHYVAGDVMRLQYADLCGVVPLPEPPLPKPVLIHPRAEVPAGSANEFAFGDDDDEER